MAHRPFASSPYIVGKERAAPAEPHIPAEDRCAQSSRTTGSTRNTSTSSSMPRPRRSRSGPASSSICSAHRPTRASCGCGGRKRLPHRPGQTPHRVPVQMRRPRHLRAGASQARRRPQHGRAARRRLQHRSRLEARRRARPRRRPRHPRADLPARGRERHRSDRDPERAQPGIRDGGRPVRQGRRGHRRARHRRHQRGGERRGDPRG